LDQEVRRRYYCKKVIKVNTTYKSMYSALSHLPNKFAGHHVRKEIYRKPSSPKDGIYTFKSKFTGFVRNEKNEMIETNVMSIGYTQWGDKGPIVLLLHGVPTNRDAKLYIQELLSPFCRTIAIDMLGMGGDETSMPQMYGHHQGMGITDGKPDDSKAWDWVNDTEYIHSLMKSLYGNEKWFFQADDWGGGILSHYIDQYPEDLLGAIWVNPIAFDGYPVSEIQAFGRAAMIPYKENDELFQMLMGSGDQTMVQIFKTMVFNPTVYNQYNLRNLKKAYIDVDYERSRYYDGEDANSLTLRLKFDNIRVLAERAAILSPALLLPYDEIENPKGVDYSKYYGPSLVIWGSQDNMMPSAQMWRFKNVLVNSPVQAVNIENAGHFVETDQPERVAESMIDFISRIVGIQNMGDIFLGYRCIWKGDEGEMIEELRRLWNIKM